jgi:hypothetical protein
MNAQVFLLVYLLPCATALMVLWLCYRLLLANSRSFQFNRFFLLTAMLFALALPLLGTLFGHTSALAGRTQPQWFSNIFLLNEITITPDGISPEGQAAASDIAHPANSTFNLWKLLGIIYLAGVIVSLIAFSVKILKITILTRRSPQRKKGRLHRSLYPLRQQCLLFPALRLFPRRKRIAGYPQARVVPHRTPSFHRYSFYRIDDDPAMV